MALRGSERDHAERARHNLIEARRNAIEALRLATEDKFERAFSAYESAVLYWGRYDAESRYGGWVGSEDDVQKRMRAARQALLDCIEE